MAAFDPRQYLIQLKGKLYLETKYRIQWFRQEHPSGCISTEIVSYDPMMIKATIFDGNGAVLATAHAGAVDKGNAVWSGRALEKSETAAVGRALAHAGYGTQFAGVEEHETRRSVDRSEERVERTTSTGPGSAPAPRRGSGNGNSASNGSRESAPASSTNGGSSGNDDLREKEVASRFIQRWRSQSLTDAEVLAALGVTKLSEWSKGRKAADEAVNAWLAGRMAEEPA
jgi:hypothetical protein